VLEERSRLLGIENVLYLASGDLAFQSANAGTYDDVGGLGTPMAPGLIGSLVAMP
jgi:hypothetical protein